MYKINKNKFSKGFTLLELLVVIIIIGLLAAIILASVNTARARGRDAKRITEIKSMQNALQIYFSANGYYPQTCFSGAGNCNSLTPTLIPVVPDGVYYTGVDTISTGQCRAYHLGVTLETNNSALSTDKDLTSNAAGLATAGYSNLCGNAYAGNTIRGAGDNVSCRAGDTGDKCYDLVP